MTGAVVRTAIWSLPLATGCPSDGVEDDNGDGDSTTAADENTMSADDGDSTTLDGGDSTTLDDGGDTTTLDDGGDSTTIDTAADSTTDDGGDTLVDGCWDRDFFDENYYAADGEPTWEPFTCALPEVCEPLDVYFNSAKVMTPKEIAAADASARCMLEALRDGTPAAHSASSSQNDGQYESRTHYYVLPDGVVGSEDWEADLSAGAQETFRGTRDAAFFDACLAETELESLVNCVVPTKAIGRSEFPPLDLDLCIDAEPVCPE